MAVAEHRLRTDRVTDRVRAACRVDLLRDRAVAGEVRHRPGNRWHDLVGALARAACGGQRVAHRHLGRRRHLHRSDGLRLRLATDQERLVLRHHVQHVAARLEPGVTGQFQFDAIRRYAGHAGLHFLSPALCIGRGDRGILALRIEQVRADQGKGHLLAAVAQHEQRPVIRRLHAIDDRRQPGRAGHGGHLRNGAAQRIGHRIRIGVQATLAHIEEGLDPLHHCVGPVCARLGVGVEDVERLARIPAKRLAQRIGHAGKTFTGGAEAGMRQADRAGGQFVPGRLEFGDDGRPGQPRGNLRCRRAGKARREQPEQDACTESAHAHRRTFIIMRTMPTVSPPSQSS